MGRLGKLGSTGHRGVGVHHNGEEHVEQNEKNKSLKEPKPDHAVSVVRVATVHHALEV